MFSNNVVLITYSKVGMQTDIWSSKCNQDSHAAYVLVLPARAATLEKPTEVTKKIRVDTTVPRLSLPENIAHSSDDIVTLKKPICAKPALEYITLGVAEAPMMHKAKDLREDAIKTLCKYPGLISKIAGWTTDTTAVNPAAFENLFVGEDQTNVWFPCFAHVQNLAVQDVAKLPFLKTMVSKVQAVVNLIRASMEKYSVQSAVIFRS